MTNFKFGDRVRVRDTHISEWVEGLYLYTAISKHYCYNVLVSNRVQVYHMCELVEAVPEVSTPKFKVGDKVQAVCGRISAQVTEINTQYKLEGWSCSWYDDELELAPKEIKVGSTVRANEGRPQREGRVLALYTDTEPCAVVQWAQLNEAYIEVLADLEVI